MLAFEWAETIRGDLAQHLSVATQPMRDSRRSEFRSGGVSEMYRVGVLNV
jgi:hypothetical protein